MRPFELKGDHVVLSTPDADDIDRITMLCQDPDIRDWTTVPSPYIRDHAATFVRHLVPEGWQTGTSLNWAMRDPDTRALMGMIGVTLSGDGRGEIGFWLDKRARRRGMVSESVRAIATRLFSDPQVNLTHLIWWAYDGNWASRRVAWATGFRHDGLVRGGQTQRGVRRDAWVATLLPGEPMRPRTRWLDIPTIHGSRVTLRPFEESDADTITEAARDAESQRWLSLLPRDYSREDALEFIVRAREKAATGQAVTWAAATDANGPAMGSFSLRLTGPHPDQGVIGYMVHPAARGAGVASEAARLMVRHAFVSDREGGLGLRRLVVEHAAGNEGSRKVIERLGFRYSGVERATAPLLDGPYSDHLRYDLLADEFE
ncbi:GNAT family N-acetyltransferase [Phytoactinopolyspora alkaliphila]|uniref:GNAT family N-acetyltransferase n=1 Tax=Phytoactinopolyspora alkaliphila TaxID=1783498 RepID=A0A6N9YR51_9ACTN|nr:GNAT family N-acetyltransferase [Phytoactinopolyspora alkaliphila]